MNIPSKWNVLRLSLSLSSSCAAHEVTSDELWLPSDPATDAPVPRVMGRSKAGGNVSYPIQPTLNESATTSRTTSRTTTTTTAATKTILHKAISTTLVI